MADPLPSDVPTAAQAHLPPGLCLPEGGWGGCSWRAEELEAAPMSEKTGGRVPHPSSGGTEGCVLLWRWGGREGGVQGFVQLDPTFLTPTQQGRRTWSFARG